MPIKCDVWYYDILMMEICLKLLMFNKTEPEREREWEHAVRGKFANANANIDSEHKPPANHNVNHQMLLKYGTDVILLFASRFAPFRQLVNARVLHTPNTTKTSKNPHTQTHTLNETIEIAWQATERMCECASEREREWDMTLWCSGSNEYHFHDVENHDKEDIVWITTSIAYTLNSQIFAHFMMLPLRFLFEYAFDSCWTCPVLQPWILLISSIWFHVFFYANV